MNGNIEIERKFLVKGNFKYHEFNKYCLQQGYLSTDPERTVRIRIKDKTGFITVKGISNHKGMSRYEWEKEVPYSEAVELIKLCKKPLIEKLRYAVKHGKHTIEIDEFYGENKGLVLAEIELQSENEALELPNFIGKEVTGDKRYYNSYLSTHPFSTW